MIVFLAVVLSVIIPFNGVFVDLIRFETSASILNRNVENANMSVLADYNGRLFDEYGIYALYETDKDKIREKIKKYIDINLKSVRRTGLYDNEIIDLACEYKCFTLSNLRKQILEYVKYRVPADSILELLGKILASADTGFINKTQDIETDISKCEDILSNLCREYNNAADKLNNFPDEFKYEDLEEARRISGEYLTYSDDAFDRLNQLQDAVSEISSKLKNLELKIKDYRKEVPDQSLYLNTIENRINELKGTLINKNFFSKNRKNIEKNKQVLISIINYDKNDTGNGDSGKSEISWEEIKKELEAIIRGFVVIELTNCKEPGYKSGDEIFDTRKENIDSLKKILSKEDNDNSKRIDDDLRKNLPSCKLKYDDNSKDITGYDNINLDDECFSKNSLSYADNLLANIKKDLKALYEEILINEYILSTFKCAVLKNPDNKYYTDLKGRTLASRNTYLDNEAEYILNGKSKDSENLFIVKAEIYFFRFCMNTLHVYMDQEKKGLAYAAALAVTALVGGAGSSFLANLIMWGWSMGESCIDVSDLLNGMKVPVYKNKSEWKLDIGIFKPKNEKSSFSISYKDYLRILLLTVPSDVKLARIADLIQLNTSMWMSGFNFIESITAITTKVNFTEKIFFPLMDLYPGKILYDKRRFRIYVEKYSGYN